MVEHSLLPFPYLASRGRWNILCDLLTGCFSYFSTWGWRDILYDLLIRCFLYFPTWDWRNIRYDLLRVRFFLFLYLKLIISFCPVWFRIWERLHYFFQWTYYICSLYQLDVETSCQEIWGWARRSMVLECLWYDIVFNIVYTFTCI